jgi:hypothetical protein
MLDIHGHKGNANQNHIKTPTTFDRMATIKTTNNNKFWQGCGKKEPSYTADENVN